jgi:hypothetical protein
MIEERSFTISDLWKLVRKEHLDSLEKGMLDDDLQILRSGYVDLVHPTNGRKTSLTDTQTIFIKHVLPNMIMYKVPKIEDVLVVYGLDMQSKFYHANAVWDPCGFFD